MMNEIANVHKTFKPQETLFVVDAMTGQDAVNTAKAFNDRLNFDGSYLNEVRWVIRVVEAAFPD